MSVYLKTIHAVCSEQNASLVHEGAAPLDSDQTKMHKECSSHCCGIIPPYLIDRAMEYYKAKGHDHIVEDYEHAKQFARVVRDHRVDKQRAHLRTMLPQDQVLEIYSAKNSERLRHVLVKNQESQNVTDLSVNEAYNGARDTYNFLLKTYQTKSIDNRNFPMRITVHYGRNYANAFWDGDEMAFGDGDQKIFSRFTKAFDIIPHELGHGLTQELCGAKVNFGKALGVEYSGEAGGINEGLSDIFAIQAKQNRDQQTVKESNWLIGEGLLKKAKGKEYALRSMKAPGTAFKDHPYLGNDAQVGHYGDYKALEASEPVDPHISSGIVNKAFYLAAEKIGGYSWEKVGKIFFDTMPYLQLAESFSGMARKTVTTAIALYGKGSAEEAAILEGWTSVGVSPN